MFAPSWGAAVVRNKWLTEGFLVLAVSTALPSWAAPRSAVVLQEGPSIQLAAPSSRSPEERAVEAVAGVGAAALRAYQQAPAQRLPTMSALLERSLDWGFIIRNSVPPELMAALDDPERQAIARAFLALSAREYAGAFNGYQGEQIDVVSTDLIGAGVVRVATRLRSPQLEGDGLSLDWIVAGLDDQNALMRDLIIDGNSMLASQQLTLAALWEEAENDKSAFLERMTSADPWGEAE